MHAGEKNAAATILALWLTTILMQQACARPGPVRTNVNSEALYEQAKKENDAGAGSRLLALSHINRALAIHPDKALYWKLKAEILSDRGEEEALPCVTRALALDPSDAGAWALKAAILRGMNKYDDANAANNQALKLDNNAGYRLARTEFLTHDKKYAEAEKELDSLAKEEPGWSRVRLRRIVAARQTKHWNKVIEDGTALAATNGHDKVEYFEGLYARAGAYMQLKQYDKAIADYKTGLKYSPNVRRFHEGLIKAYQLAGNTKAAEAQGKALESLDGDLVPFK